MYTEFALFGLFCFAVVAFIYYYKPGYKDDLIGLWVDDADSSLKLAIGKMGNSIYMRGFGGPAAQNKSLISTEFSNPPKAMWAKLHVTNQTSDTIHGYVIERGTKPQIKLKINSQTGKLEYEITVGPLILARKYTKSDWL